VVRAKGKSGEMNRMIIENADACAASTQVSFRLSLSPIMLCRLLSVGIICGATIGLTPALADENKLDGGNASPEKHSAYKKASGQAAVSPDEDYDTLTLEMVRDVGVSLHQMKELAIYIFKEATRKPLTASDPSVFQGFDSISEKDIEPDAKYLKPRPGWIFFYVGTLEPPVQLLRDAESERIYIPRKSKNQAVKLSAEFNLELEKIRQEIKKLHKFIDSDTHGAQDVARSAVAIYNATAAMEKIRLESYELVRDAEKEGKKDSVLF